MKTQKQQVLFIAFTMFTLVGCGSSGSSGDGSEAAQNQSPAPAPSPSPTPGPIVNLPPDYSKITCSTVADCVKACDLDFPKTTESMVRAYCDPGAAVQACNAIVDFHFNDYVLPNIACKARKVTEVIDPSSIGRESCAANAAGCANTCAAAFQPDTDAHVRAITQNGGAEMKALVRNQVVREALAACLAAPANFVIPGI